MPTTTAMKVRMVHVAAEAPNIQNEFAKQQYTLHVFMYGNECIE